MREGRDAGEAEAVIQASGKSATMVLVDDALGRTWAAKHALDCHGTIWICRQLRHQGYLTELRPYYVRMLQRRRRQPLKEMNRYLQEFGEPLLTSEEYREYTSPSQSSL